MTTLEELRERLEKAEGLDELDWGLIGLTLMVPLSSMTNAEFTRWQKFLAADAFLDASMALVEVKLPTGYRRSASMRTANGWMYFIKGDGNDSFEGWHKSEPIALLLALIAALQEQSQ